MKYKKFKDIELSRLGLGVMRMPLVDKNDPKSQIDYEKAHAIMDGALESGINYFDTAYVYNGGENEKCLGEWIAKQDRSKFYVATKYNINANPDFKAAFDLELERLQTDYVDFYLMHCLMDSNIDKFLESGAIEYFLEKQKEGKIKYLGFSSHASLSTLEKFASHHDWDFAQIQFNFFDYNYRTAKAEYDILTGKNIPIMVMEPVRGGRLAKLTPDAEKLLKDVNPNWSVPSWALRFVKSMPNVQVILSGMSDLDQLKDNVDTFSDDLGLNESEMDVLNKACDLFKSQLQVPCTGCRYCTDDCPMEINIPEFLNVYNSYKVDGRGALEKAEKVESNGKPSDCIGCGACTSHCPQNIDTPKIMEELSELLKK